MTPDLLFALAQANLAGSAGALAAIALRKHARLLFGARAAYHLWALVPLVAAASFLPPRPAALAPAPVAAMAPADLVATAGEDLSNFFSATPSIVTHAAAGVSPVLAVCALWVLGLLLMAAWLTRRQLQFMGDLKRGDAGPAVVGFLKPRIVTPSDFEERFNSREQTVVLAHEKIHLARHDARINAFVALTRCVCWFNPLVHLAAYLMRIDQELACDAAVVERHPKARAPYAQALLKAQLAARPLPLGCYWPAGTEHPLTERIAMLKRSNPSRPRRLAGAALVGVLGLTASYAAWAAAPAAAPAASVPVEYLVDAFTPEPVVTPDPAPALTPALEPAPAPRPGPLAPAPQTGVDMSSAKTVEGVITMARFTYPTSSFTVRDANGQETTITTDDNNALVAGGATLGQGGSIHLGAPMTVQGYAATDGSGIYADPADFSSNGAPLFPKAQPKAGLVLDIAHRVQVCGVMPNPPAPDPADPELGRRTFAAWKANCDAALAQAQGSAKEGGIVTHAITTNSVKREGAP